MKDTRGKQKNTYYGSRLDIMFVLCLYGLEFVFNASFGFLLFFITVASFVGVICHEWKIIIYSTRKKDNRSRL